MGMISNFATEYLSYAIFAGILIIGAFLAIVFGIKKEENKNKSKDKK